MTPRSLFLRETWHWYSIYYRFIAWCRWASHGREKYMDFRGLTRPSLLLALANHLPCRLIRLALRNSNHFLSPTTCVAALARSVLQSQATAFSLQPSAPTSGRSMQFRDSAMRCTVHLGISALSRPAHNRTNAMSSKAQYRDLQS